MHAFHIGLLLGFSLIIAIGAQNLFLIRQGVLNQHAFFSAFVCLLCDALLMFLGVTSLGLVLLKLPLLKEVFLVGGLIFLFYCGGSCFYRAFSGSRGEGLDVDKKNVSHKKVLFLAMSFSLLNPQAIIDTVVLMGGSANQFEGEDKYFFLLGGISSSVIWFFTLVFLARRYATKLLKRRVWQCLEVISGFFMWGVLLTLIEKLF